MAKLLQNEHSIMFYYNNRLILRTFRPSQNRGSSTQLFYWINNAGSRTWPNVFFFFQDILRFMLAYSQNRVWFFIPPRIKSDQHERYEEMGWFCIKCFVGEFVLKSKTCTYKMWGDANLKDLRRSSLYRKFHINILQHDLKFRELETSVTRTSLSVILHSYFRVWSASMTSKELPWNHSCLKT